MARSVAWQDEIIGLPWISIWAFIRITTDSRIFTRGAPPEKSFRLIEGFLALPNVTIPRLGGRHFDLLKELVIQRQAAGKLVTDAALASLCLEHGAVLASTDLDFGRFSSLRWINPLA